VGAIVQTAGANPTLLSIARWDPSSALEALFSTARRAKL